MLRRLRRIGIRPLDLRCPQCQATYFVKEEESRILRVLEAVERKAVGFYRVYGAYVLVGLAVGSCWSTFGTWGG